VFSLYGAPDFLVRNCILSEEISVVIVTFNNADMLTALLDDLRIQSRLPDSIIIVDNASHDHTESMIKGNYPEVKYVKLEENKGSAGGYYEGIKHAADSSDFIYTLDDDVRLKPNTLAKIIAGFWLLEKSMPGKIGAVRSVGEHHPEAVPTKLEIVPWRGTLLKTEIIREIGLPSPDFFLYGEDLEYSLRMAKKGYRFYWIPTSVCQEKSRAHEGKSRRLFMGRMGVHYEDPFRLYYAFRNEVSIYLQYRYVSKLIHTLLYAVKVLLMISVSEGWHGQKSLQALLCGIADGFLGRMGKNLNFTPL